MRYQRIVLIILDSLGIGELPDAKDYGDNGANTFKHIAEVMNGLDIPNMEKLGLSHIYPINVKQKNNNPIGAYGKMAELSIGKDTLTGHWEMMGLKTDIAFNIYPDGFPKKLIKSFENRINRNVIGNKPASGVDIINEYGEQHINSDDIIVYTSADSVFQIAAHEGRVPVDELYKICEIARELTLEKDYYVGRVIARPFVGKPGSFQRTMNRKDYTVKPPAKTVMNYLVENDYQSIAIGKIADIFANEGITKKVKSISNNDGVNKLIEELKQNFEGLVFLNLVDFDMLYGHRRDAVGYGKAIEEFDLRLPDIINEMGGNDLLILTADHGNDPSHFGSDHTREYVPLLVYSESIKTGIDLGVRETFADVGATIADNFNINMPKYGKSFLNELLID